ncbi:ABC transporter ATP-binding protein [Listeria sp. SHR_NRA_18]|uniref:ABC transporter ATP-binding protein n=1 Tax=Listeria sp. SHR_NRA_18 TaxID=2269046 RepID=UPI00051D4EBE|nr:ABC transporter ATP-binding protein [Listeria sp. SHR_NRA_18]KGL39199.1 antibiotic ABC transporter ATP-binding protein [Listeriaceae bacterium FSL A5-0209]RQW66418.1 ABC transporter ATP-binding protein [Listeria sp. SHR_NRA_18]
MKIVEIEQLTKKFEKNIAVDNLDLTIEEGQIFGLLGPNGAGKSTTISVLCGLLKKNSGQIRLFGEEQETHSLEIKQRIGLVPQDIALYIDLSAFENVRFFAGLYGLRGKGLDAAANTALEFVGLADKAKDKPGTFSGGMKRRLNIACAIAHKPELIIMDEPTVGIDPQSRNYILKSIKKLNASGCTIIYTSHYMEEVEELCDYISIIDHGKVIAEGTKEQLVSLVSDRKEMRLVVDDASKIDLGALRAIPGILAVDVTEGNVLGITSNSEVNNLNAVLERLIGQAVEVLEMNQQTLNLETVFLNLTGRKLRD